MTRISVKPIFAWYDLWVGIFWDRTKRKLYVLPLPTLGIVIQFFDVVVSKSDGVPLKAEGRQ